MGGESMGNTYGSPEPYGGPQPLPDPGDWGYRPRRRLGRSCGGCLIAAFLVTVSLAAIIALLLFGGTGLRTGTGAGGSNGPSGSGATRGSAAAAGSGGIPGKVDPGLVDVVCTLGYLNAESAGTGLVLTPTGEVLTNNHVINGATSIRVTDVGNGRTYKATVVGYDIHSDIAVLQLRGAANLKTVSLGSSSSVKVGQKITALGNAGGRGGTPSVASGIVTGLDKSITATDQAAGSSEQLAGLIRTDAALQPGDSGGPLVNAAGQVIGLDTAASVDYQFQQVSAQGFAIPVNTALAIFLQILAGRSSPTVHIGATGFIGVQLEWRRSQNGSSYPVVVTVLPGLPAANAGITQGDVIESVGGRAASTSADVQDVLQLLHPGSHVTVRWIDLVGVTHSASLVLATGPAD